MRSDDVLKIAANNLLARMAVSEYNIAIVKLLNIYEKCLNVRGK